MKLQNNKRNKKLIIVAIVIAVLIAAIAIGAIVISNVIKDHQNTLTGIMVSSKPSKTVYTVGEEFDYSGLVLQVLANSNDASYFVYDTDSGIKCTGFDTNTVGDQVITVTYMEFTTTFTVKVKEAPPPPVEKTLTSLRLTDNFITSYSLNEWNSYGPNFYGVRLICTFSDGSEKEVSGVIDYCDPIDYALESAGTYNLVIRYGYAGKYMTLTVPITITN